MPLFLPRRRRPDAACALPADREKLSRGWRNPCPDCPEAPLALSGALRWAGRRGVPPSGRPRLPAACPPGPSPSAWPRRSLPDAAQDHQGHRLVKGMGAFRRKNAPLGWRRGFAMAIIGCPIRSSIGGSQATASPAPPVWEEGARGCGRRLLPSADGKDGDAGRVGPHRRSHGFAGRLFARQMWNPTSGGNVWRAVFPCVS